MLNKNTKGPKIDPRRTPVKMSRCFEERFFFGKVVTSIT